MFIQQLKLARHTVAGSMFHDSLAPQATGREMPKCSLDQRLLMTLSLISPAP